MAHTETLNELKLHRLTGKARQTIRERLRHLTYVDGPRGSKNYDSRAALEAVYQIQDVPKTNGTGAVVEGTRITNEEAQRLLTIARREQIDLEMAVTRKERPHITDVTELLDATFANIRGTIMASKLEDQAKDDILTELQEAKL